MGVTQAELHVEIKMKHELDLFFSSIFYNELSCGRTSVEHVLEISARITLQRVHINKYAQAGTFNKEKSGTLS